MEPVLRVFKFLSDVVAVAIAVAESQVPKMFTVNHVCRRDPSLAGILCSIEGGGEQSLPGQREFSLLSHKLDEKLLWVCRLCFELFWPTIFMFQTVEVSCFLRFHKQYILENPTCSSRLASLYVSEPKLAMLGVWETPCKTRV